MTGRSILAVVLTGVMLAVCGLARGEETGMSLNREIMVVPAPGAVTIDGDAKDWDLSAGVWSYNTPAITAKFSVWTHLMWDARGVYFLARFADASPLQNPTKGQDFAHSWRSDCYQARVIFDDRTPDEHMMHVNMFYSTPEGKPHMIVKHGGFGDKGTGPDRPEQLEEWGLTMEKAVGQVAFRKWDDGKGYNCEAFWPWEYCRTNGQPLKAGEPFVFGIEALWGGGHRLADGIQNDKVNRIFMFRARDGWGRAIISEKGKLGITADQESLRASRLKMFTNYDTYGSIAVNYDLPDDREVTVAIDDATGKRVRNLFGQYPRSKGANKELWDGLDDDGRPVAAGRYTVTVVDHKPVEVKFVNSLYNAGTPPWATENGRKLWGSNHGNPSSAASRGDVTLLTFVGNEGATGIQRVNAEGIIQWAVADEVTDVAIGDQHCYTFSPNWQVGTGVVRYDLKTGAQVPFGDANRSPYIPLPREASGSSLSTIGLLKGKLYLLLQPRTMLTLDAETGKIEAESEIGDLRALTVSGEKLYTLTKDGTVGLRGEDGATQKVCTVDGLKDPVRLAVSQDQKRIAISDQGTNQVVVCDITGKRIVTLGEAYEEEDRPAGKFVETNLIKPQGAAFDQAGRLWVAEASKTTRRITLWSPQGQLLKQFWGGADYGAMAGFPVTFDSTRFVAHGIEFQLDPNPDPLTRPTAEKPLIYHPDLAGSNRGIIYRYKDHDYAYTVPGYNGGGRIKIAKRDADGVFRWCTEVYAGAHYWSVGWARPDLTIISTDCRIFPLKGISEDGVPLYDQDKPVTPANKITTRNAQGSTGTIAMDNAGNISDGIQFHTVDGRRGAYPNRYGRHDAPAAQRGVLIAPFRTNGVVEGVPGVGSITALAGDRGEWFLLSMDGLYLSSILQDTKGEITLDDTFVGQESFGGFIWKDEKGRILVQLGGASYRIMEIKGLETTRKQVLSVDVTAEQIEAGQRIAAARMEAAGAEPKELTIAKVAALPADAVAGDLPKAQPLLAGVPEVLVKERGDASRWWRAAMAHDGKDLLIVWQVADASPWRNGAGSFTHAFIGGDCVDVKLAVPGRSLVRVLVAAIQGKDTVIYSQQKAAVKDNPMTYMVGNNAANATNLDVVKRLATATAQSATSIAGYTVTLRVPLAELGLDIEKVQSIKGVIGVIYSDPTGTNRVARLYWNDKQTDLVSDVPSEARIDAARFGPIMIGK